jgi:hypothetical protein
MTKHYFSNNNYIKFNFCEKQQRRQWRAVFVDVWSLFVSYLLLGQQKDEYLCSFFEAVPSFVILCHLLQPVVHLLLRLAVAVFVVLVPSLLLILLPLIHFLDC